MLDKDQLLFISEAEQFETEVRRIIEDSDPEFKDFIIDLLYDTDIDEDRYEITKDGQRLCSACSVIALARIGFNHMTEKRITEEDGQP